MSTNASVEAATVPVVPPADELMGRLIDVDHCDRDALIALDARGIAGVARYAALPGQSTYDVAVVVADDWQGKGLPAAHQAPGAHRATARHLEADIPLRAHI